MAIQRASPDARELANCIERDVRVIGERLIGAGQDQLTVEACVGAHGNGTVRGHDPPCPSRGQRSSLTMSRISEKSPALTLTIRPGDHTCMHQPRSWLPHPYLSPPAPPSIGYSSASMKPTDDNAGNTVRVTDPTVSCLVW